MDKQKAINLILDLKGMYIDLAVRGEFRTVDNSIATPALLSILRMQHAVDLITHDRLEEAEKTLKELSEKFNKLSQYSLSRSLTLSGIVTEETEDSKRYAGFSKKIEDAAALIRQPASP